MRTFATLAVTLALIGGLARAQDKVELKPTYKAGESYTLDMTTSSHMSGSVQNMTFDFKNHSHTAYTDTILEVKDSRPTKVKRTYQADETTQEQTMPRRGPSTQKTTKPYVGKTYTLVKDGDKVKVQETTQTAQELQRSGGLLMSPKVELLLPDHAVAKGESWNLTKEQLQQLLSQGKKESIEDVSATCTYEGMTSDSGKQVAKIQVTMTVKGQQQGAHGQMGVDMKLSGPLLFDTDLGLPVSLTLDGTLALSRGPMTFQGPMKMQATLTPSK